MCISFHLSLVLFRLLLYTTFIHLTNDVSQKTLPYPLLSDRKRLLIGALGAADGAKTKRSHFVVGKGGVLLDKRMPVKPADR
jgi:peroxiredoxin